MSVGALFSSWYYECGLQGNQDWLKIFFPPVWECGLIVLWKTTKNNVFRMRPSLGKNSKFDLLGRLNECRDPFLIVMIFMWTSRQWKPPFVCFWLFLESFFSRCFQSRNTFLKRSGWISAIVPQWQWWNFAEVRNFAWHRQPAENSCFLFGNTVL